MGGIASLIAIVVNILKQVGVVQDGTAKNWAAGFNILALVGLYVLQVFKPDILPENVNGMAASLSQILVVVMQFIIQAWGSRLARMESSRLCRSSDTVTAPKKQKKRRPSHLRTRP